MKYFTVLLMAVLMAGCDSFQKKPPPDAEIVTSFDAGTCSTGKAVDDFTDSLVAFVRGRLEGARVQLKVEEGRQLKRYAEKILLNTRRAVDFQQADANPDYVVTARFTELTPDVFNWQMSLARSASPGTPLWRYSVKVDTYKID